MVKTAAAAAVRQGREGREAVSLRVEGNVRPPGLLLQDNPFRLGRQQRSSDMQAASWALTVQATPTLQEINKKLKRSQQFSTQSRWGFWVGLWFFPISTFSVRNCVVNLLYRALA